MDTRTPVVIRSYILLTLTAFIWGFAFSAQRIGGENLGPFSFNAIRFTLGGLSIMPLALKNRTSIARASASATGAPTTASSARANHSPQSLLILGSIACGIILFAGASFQQVGLIWTEAGKAAFLTGLYIILIPLVGLIAGKKQPWTLGLGAILGAAGLYFLSVGASFGISIGDSLEILSAVCWTFHILLLGFLALRFNAIIISCIQNIVCAFLSLIVAFFAESFSLSTITTAFTPGPQGALIPILFAGIVSIGIAYTMQIAGQKHVSPGPASLVMSLETVFAALGGWLILGETMSGRAIFGAILMLGGMVVAQIAPSRKATSSNK